MSFFGSISQVFELPSGKIKSVAVNFSLPSSITVNTDDIRLRKMLKFGLKSPMLRFSGKSFFHTFLGFSKEE